MLEEENKCEDILPDDDSVADEDTNSDDESVNRLKSKLDEAYGKQEDLHTKYLRTVADLENVRKRSIRDRDEAIQRTKKQIIEDLLPVIDSFNMGIGEASKVDSDGPLVKGFQMAIEQLNSVLADYGLTQIDAVGGEFDPQIHEVIGYESTDKDGFVLSIVRHGYKIKDNLIRPASVIVSKLESIEK